MATTKTNPETTTNTKRTKRGTTMTQEYTLTEEETEKIACAINHYLESQYLRITDVYSVIENRELVEENPNIWAYHCPCQTIYLDDNAYAVNCGRQYVSKIYYNSDGEALVDSQGKIDTNPNPNDVDHMVAKVYYDFRSEIPVIPVDFEGDTSLANVLTPLGDYEWKRTEPGGGGIL